MRELPLPTLPLVMVTGPERRRRVANWLRGAMRRWRRGAA